MLAPHIQEREDRKALDLLGFALTQSGIEASAWAIAAERHSLPPVDDCICLFKESGEWVVAYTERGQWRDLGRFPGTYEASRYYFSQFRPGPSPYDLRERWEAATGLEFSMVD